MVAVALLVAVLAVEPAEGSTAPAAWAAPSNVEQKMDPGEPGDLDTRRIEYDAQVTVVQQPVGDPPGYAYPERLRGVLHLPVGDPGPFPVVVFLHGRHGTCRVAGSTEALVWPCPDAPPVLEDLPSWRGFDYAGSVLASHGYVVVSANANAVNVVGSLDGTQERQQIVRRTLDLIEEWNDGPRPIPDGVGGELEDRVDLQRIGLVGHSRGAAAVSEFLNERAPGGPDRFPGLKAVLSIQGLDMSFSEEGGQIPTGAHYGAIFGTCDGDVGLSGVAMWDRGRFRPDAAGFARVAFLVHGANHNFFNSEWPDEWPFAFDELTGGPDDPTCMGAHSTNIRLTPTDQQRLGATLIAGFLRRYVGEETQFEPLMNGTALLSPGACPTERFGSGRPVACDELVRTSYVPPADEILVLTEPGDGLDPGIGVASTQAEGFSSAQVCWSAECPEPVAGRARQLALTWEDAAVLRAQLPTAVDVSRFGGVTMRVHVNRLDERNGGLASQDFDVVLIDAGGRTAQVAAGGYGNALRVPAERPHRRMALGGLRVPLAAFTDIDLRAITTVELRFGSVPTGSLNIAEVSFAG